MGYVGVKQRARNQYINYSQAIDGLYVYSFISEARERFWEFTARFRVASSSRPHATDNEPSQANSRAQVHCHCHLHEDQPDRC